MMFYVLVITFSHMKFVSICFIDSGMNFNLIFDVLLDTFSIRVGNLLNLQNHYFYNEYNDFSFQRNMIFDEFLDL